MKKSFVRYKYLSISIIILFLLLSFLSPTVLAQDEQQNPGGKVALIVKDDVLPQIGSNQWTYINFTAIDQYDFNWTQLSSTFNNFQMKVVWPIMFGDLQLARYLGYTTVELSADVVDQDNNIAEGWSAQAVPSVIEETTQGEIHDLQVQVQTHDLAVDYSVTLRIKITRKDAWGAVEGFSYAYIPLKAASLNYIEMSAEESTKKVAPVSIAKFNLEVTNKGYYPDIFRFKIKGENNVVGIVDSQGLYLNPGETQVVTLHAMTPENFFDPGTSNRLEIYTWSRLNQTQVNIGSVNVITEGIYVSPLIIFSIGIILLVLIVVFLLYRKYSDILEKKNLKKKPEKENKKKFDFKKYFLNFSKEKPKNEKESKDTNENKSVIKEKPKPKKIIEDEEEFELIEPKTSKREIEIRKRKSQKEKILNKIKRKQENQKTKLGK